MPILVRLPRSPANVYVVRPNHAYQRVEPLPVRVGRDEGELRGGSVVLRPDSRHDGIVLGLRRGSVTTVSEHRIGFSGISRLRTPVAFDAVALRAPGRELPEAELNRIRRALEPHQFPRPQTALNGVSRLREPSGTVRASVRHAYGTYFCVTREGGRG